MRPPHASRKTRTANLGRALDLAGSRGIKRPTPPSEASEEFCLPRDKYHSSTRLVWLQDSLPRSFSMGLTFSRDIIDGTLRPFKLDIGVPLIIFLGEYCRSYNWSGARAASWSCIIPRLVSATPLLGGPYKETKSAFRQSIVTGTSNTPNIAKELHWLPNLLHPIDNLRPYEFKVFRIRCKSKTLAFHYDNPSLLRTEAGNLEGKKNATLMELLAEKERLDQSQQGLRQWSRKCATYLRDCAKDRVLVLSVSSLLVTIGLIVWSILTTDGLALIGILLLCLATSINGLSSKWTCRALEKRPVPGESTYSTSSTWPHILFRWIRKSSAKPFSLSMLEAHSVLDARMSLMDRIQCQIVICTRNGALVVVHCTEAVASLIYTTSSGTAHFCIKSDAFRRLLNACTPMLFFGALFCFASCTWTMEFVVGCAYVVLLLLCEVLFAFSKCPVDIGHFGIEEDTPRDCRDAHAISNNMAESEQMPHFARTFWHAIRQTTDSSWAASSGIMPPSIGWRQWLLEATHHRRDMQWPAVAECTRLTDREVVFAGALPPVIFWRRPSPGWNWSIRGRVFTLPPIRKW